jgi:hypothetical protein
MSLSFNSLPRPIHRRKMLQQQLVNEAIAAGFLQDDRF